MAQSACINISLVVKKGKGNGRLMIDRENLEIHTKACCPADLWYDLIDTLAYFISYSGGRLRSERIILAIDSNAGVPLTNESPINTSSFRCGKARCKLGFNDATAYKIDAMIK